MQAHLCSVEWKDATYFYGCPTWSCGSGLSFYGCFLRGSKINPWAWSSLCLKDKKFRVKNKLKNKHCFWWVKIILFRSGLTNTSIYVETFRWWWNRFLLWGEKGKTDVYSITTVAFYNQELTANQPKVLVKRHKTPIDLNIYIHYHI